MTRTTATYIYKKGIQEKRSCTSCLHEVHDLKSGKKCKMNKKYLIKHGTVVSAAERRKADILVTGEKIEAVGVNLECQDAQVIDAEGKYIFPGFLDTHTHFDLDAGDFHTADDFYTGTKAAVCGGTTTILDFTTQEKGQSLKEALNVWNRMADGSSSCDYGFHMSITDWNDSVKEELNDMSLLGVPSYKLYMAYDNLKVNDQELYEILSAVEKEQGIIGVHCENGEIIKAITAQLKADCENSVALHPKSRPAEAEAEAIHRLLVLAKLAGTPVNIVHLSSALGLQEIRRARAEGQKVFVETCPQYLLLEDSVYDRPGFEGAAYVCSPPIRKAKDREALWEAIAAGEIDMIGTDHCSFHMKTQKIRGKNDFTRIPGGMPGVEHRPVLFYTEGVKNRKIPVEMMCNLLSERPARLFGMYPKKGVIEEGSDADLVIWDPDKEWTITAENQIQNVDHTPYEGMKVCGMPEKVFLRGCLTAENGKMVRELGGCYVYRGKRQL